MCVGSGVVFVGERRFLHFLSDLSNFAYTSYMPSRTMSDFDFPVTLQRYSRISLSSFVRRISVLSCFGLALGGRPILGLKSSPHLLSYIYNSLCTDKSQYLFFYILIKLSARAKQSAPPIFVRSANRVRRPAAGAGSRGRTDTVSLPRDFESRASANSAIPADTLLLYKKNPDSASPLCRMRGHCHFPRNRVKWAQHHGKELTNGKIPCFKNTAPAAARIP